MTWRECKRPGICDNRKGNPKMKKSQIQKGRPVNIKRTAWARTLRTIKLANKLHKVKMLFVKSTRFPIQMIYIYEVPYNQLPQMESKQFSWQAEVVTFVNILGWVNGAGPSSVDKLATVRATMTYQIFKKIVLDKPRHLIDSTPWVLLCETVLDFFLLLQSPNTF